MTETNETSPSPPNRIEDAIRLLRKSDKVGVAGATVGVGAGVAAGAAAAGSVAGAAGATTLLGSTTLASVLSGVVVTATPVGWVLGCGVAGGLAAYGIIKLVRSGAKNDEVRGEMADRLEQEARTEGKQVAPTGELDELQERLTAALSREAITEAQANRIFNLVSQGKLSSALAIKRLQSVIDEKTA